MTGGAEEGAPCPPCSRGCRIAQSAAFLGPSEPGHLRSGDTSACASWSSHLLLQPSPAQHGLCLHQLCHAEVRNLNLSAFRDLLTAGDTLGCQRGLGTPAGEMPSETPREHSKCLQGAYPKNLLCCTTLSPANSSEYHEQHIRGRKS